MGNPAESQPANKNVARSDATRRGLVDVAIEVFTEKGFADASIGDIVERTGMTRGALYHHYEGKADLFRAAFERLERELMEEAAAAASEATDAWDGLRRGLHATLNASLKPEIRQIVIKDATAVIGWDDSRALMDRYALGALKQGLHLAIGPEAATELVDAAAHILLGSLMEGAALIAASDDPDATNEAVGSAIDGALSGIRTLA